MRWPCLGLISWSFENFRYIFKRFVCLVSLILPKTLHLKFHLNLLLSQLFVFLVHECDLLLQLVNLVSISIYFESLELERMPVLIYIFITFVKQRLQITIFDINLTTLLFKYVNLLLQLYNNLLEVPLITGLGCPLLLQIRWQPPLLLRLWVHPDHLLKTGDVLLLVIDLTHQFLHLCLFLAEFQGHLLVLKLLSLEDIFDFLRFLEEPTVVVLQF